MGNAFSKQGKGKQPPGKESENESGVADVDEKEESFAVIDQETEPPSPHGNAIASAALFTRTRWQRWSSSPASAKDQKDRQDGKNLKEASPLDDSSDITHPIEVTDRVPKLDTYEEPPLVFPNMSEPEKSSSESVDSHAVAEACVKRTTSTSALVPGSQSLKPFRSDGGENTELEPVGYTTKPASHPLPIPGMRVSHVQRNEVFERQYSVSLPNSSGAVATLEAKLQRKMKSEDDLRMKLHETTVAKDKAEKELMDTKVQLRMKDAENMRLKAEIQSLQTKTQEMERLKSQLASKEKQYENTREENEKLLQENKKLLQENEVLYRENRQKEQQYEREIGILKERIIEVTKKESKCKDEIMALKEKQFQLEMEIQKMKTEEEAMKRVIAEERQEKAEVKVDLAGERQKAAERKAELAEEQLKQEKQRCEESEAEVQKLRILLARFQNEHSEDSK